MKVCGKCREEKDDTEFYRGGHGQLYSYCKKCWSIYTAAYSENRKNSDPTYKEKILIKNRETSRRYYSNPENRKRKYSIQTCKIIRDHHEDLKDDPEHLTTEFIQKLVGSKCDI